ncbi:unnamed protein product [Rotaria sp. Silwood2]|nr:unnamed protein product [Rotaria sp. Silwood2]
MSIDKQTILYNLNSKGSACSTPLMFSRDSSMETLSSFNVNFHSHNSTYTSEHSTNPSGIISPSDIPDSPPRGSDDDIDTIEQQRTIIQPLNLTRSTGTTVIERTDNYLHDDNDVDSIRNYATSSPQRISYNDNDDDDDNNSIHSSLSSLTLPLPPSSSTSSTTQTLLSNINELRNLKRNLSIINEESLHEQNERQKSSFDISNTTITTTDDDDDDDDEDEDQKGKRLLFELIRQRLPHHHISLTNTSDSSSKINDIDCQNKSKGTSSTSSSSINDQVIFHKEKTSLVPFHRTIKTD